MAEYNGYTGVWRRLKSGAAIFIRDGEDIKKAVRRNFNSEKLTQKRKDIIGSEERAFDFEQAAKKDKLIAFREKGELSDKYDEAVRTERAWKKEQDRLRQERYDVEDEQQRITARNRFGMAIKKDQFDRLKEVGQVNKNTADLENSIIAHKETRAKINKVGVQNASTELISKDLANEIGMNEFKNKYFRFYGYDAMKDVETDTIKSLDKATLGKAQTDKFKAEVSRTPKQRAAAIDKANDNYYEKTKKDLLSHYTKDNGYDGDPEEAFVKQMDAVNYGNATPYQMGKRLAEGGNYLIYNGDMKVYLSRRGIKATEDNVFDKYTDYIAKQSAKLYEEIKKNKK